MLWYLLGWAVLLGSLIAESFPLFAGLLFFGIMAVVAHLEKLVDLLTERLPLIDDDKGPTRRRG